MRATNLVFIMADEHNAAAMGAAGHPLVKTPRLDRLAAAGTRFAGAYTPSPLCVPARAAMATGRPAHATGYWDGAMAYDGRVPGWPHRLSGAGHLAVSIGKLHYRDGDVDTGFAETIEAMHLKDGIGDVHGLLREAMPPRTACRRLAEELGPGDSDYLRYDRRITAQACRWLEAAARPAGRPWALFVSFAAPHYPLIAPPEFYELYAGLDIPLPETAAPDDLHPWVSAMRRAWPYDDYMDDEKRRVAVAAYFALCSFMDANVGRVLDTLEETGLAAATRVIYASDHGESLGNRGLWGKMTMYEDAARIPLIVAGPDIPQAKVSGTPVSLLDIYPTALAALGVAPDAREADGRAPAGASLIDIAAGRDDPDRAVISEYHGAGAAGAAFMLRHGRHKLIHYVGHAPELFDLAADPHERNDLARAPDHAALLAACEARLGEIVDPAGADARARAAQQALLARLGGMQAVLERAGFAGTPAPGG
jgi:choline-sulfatase